MTNDSRSSSPPSSRPAVISFQEYRDEKIVDFFANEHRTFQPEGSGNDFGRDHLVGASRFPAKPKGTAAFRISFGENEASRDGAVGEEATIPLPAKVMEEILEAAPDVLAATLREPPKKNKEIRPESSFGKQARPIAAVLGGRSGHERLKQAASVLRDPLTPQGGSDSSRKIPTHNRPILVARLQTPPLQDGILPMSNVSEQTEFGFGPEVSAETAAETATENGATPEILSVEQAILDNLEQTDRQLGRLIESWPKLSERLKETITALVDVAESEYPEPEA